MNSLLEIKNLHTYYETFQGTAKVLKGVNLNLKKGEKVGLTGESGCGKTTTLKSILRILPPNSTIPQGEILYKGENLLKRRSMKEIRRGAISMIFQDPTGALNPVFKVGKQLTGAIKYSNSKLSDKEAKTLAEENLKKVGLSNTKRIMDSFPFQLSGGMKQRVCIAIANATARDIILADEPTTNLDVTITEQVLREIHKLVQRENLSVILVSQALGLLKNITDRTFILYAGTVVEVAKSDEIFTDPLHPYTKGLISSVPKLTGEGIPKGVPGRISDYVDPPSGCRFHPRCDGCNNICEKEPPQVIDVGNDHKVACHLYS